MQGFLNYIAIHSIVCAQRFPVEKNEASNSGFCHPCAVNTSCRGRGVTEILLISVTEILLISVILKPSLIVGILPQGVLVCDFESRGLGVVSDQQFLLHVVPLIFVLCS